MRINKMIALEKMLNSFVKKMYRDQYGELIRVYWGLKG